MPTRASRRACLKGGAAAGASLLLTGCEQAVRYATQPRWPAWLPRLLAEPDDPALRALNRFAFGPRPADPATSLEAVRSRGVDRWLEEQLHPEGIAEDPAAEWRVNYLDSLNTPAADLYDMPADQARRELQQAAVVRAVYSRRQLREVMVEFWTDHFNITQAKGDDAWLKTTDDLEVIRRHALGSFRDLLRASARSPAMLLYLDGDKNRAGVPNENYARELMELHTLGVHGGYTQKDVQEVARCFTGWTIAGGFWRGGFHYDPARHDCGPKRVLGRLIHARSAQEGIRDGEEVLEVLATHPATARFLARKLRHRFISERPLPRLERALAAEFRATGGSIAATVRALFRSDEFRCGAGPKYKRPFQFAITALRALNADTDGAGGLLHLEKMGQRPFQWARPDGYPDRAEAWFASLLGRWNFALALVSNGIAGTSVDLAGLLRATQALEPEQQLEALAGAILGRLPPEPVRDRLLGVLEGAGPQPDRIRHAAAAMLCSPAFQWR